MFSTHIPDRQWTRRGVKKYENSKVWFIKADADPYRADGTNKYPFPTVQEAQHFALEGDTLRLIRSGQTIDEEIFLKDCQKLLGSEVPKRFTLSDQPRFTRVTNSTAPGHVIHLANHNEVANLLIYYGGRISLEGGKAGVAIFGDNIQGAHLHHLIIRKQQAMESDLLDPTLCDYERDPKTDALLPSQSTLRGCFVSGYPQRIGAIMLLADDRSGHEAIHHRIHYTIIQDAQSRRNVEGRSPMLWSSGVSATAAGNVKMTIEVFQTKIKQTLRGLIFFAYDQSVLVGNIRKVTIDSTQNDAIEGLTGFFCSGHADDHYLPFQGTCEAITKSLPAPVSDAELILNIHQLRATQNLRRADGSAAGIELVANDRSGSRHTLHVEESKIYGFNWGFLPYIFGELDFSLYDLGCLNPTDDPEAKPAIDICNDMGYTSRGKNHIWGNSNGRVEIMIADSYGNTKVMAQNNYWGDYNRDQFGDSLPPCIHDLAPPYQRCVILEGKGEVNANFPILEP